MDSEFTIGGGTDGTVVKIDENIVEKHYVDKDIEYSILREVDFYAKIQHLNLPFIKVYSWGLNSNNVYYLRMKRYDMTLDDYILETGDNTQKVVDVAYTMACDLIRALDFLHSNSMMHRDIKASNVLMNSSKSKFVLGDMCRCAYLNYTRTVNMTTEYCAAPEVNIDDFNEGFHSDMYSFGDLIGRTLCLMSSYENRVCDWYPEMRRFKSKYNGNDYGLVDLVLKLTSNDINERPTAKECAKFLNIQLTPYTFSYTPTSKYGSIPLSAYNWLVELSKTVLDHSNDHVIEHTMEVICRFLSKTPYTKFSMDRIVVSCLFLVVKTRSDYGYDFDSLYKFINTKYEKTYTSDLEHFVWVTLSGVINAQTSENVHNMFCGYIESNSVHIIKKRKLF